MDTQGKKTAQKGGNGSKAHSNGGSAERGLSRMQPPGALRNFRDQFDRLFDQFFGGWDLGFSSRFHQNWDLKMHEADDAVTIRAEAPGFEPDDFDIHVRGDNLVLCAYHETESKGDEAAPSEWSRQEFFRSVPLPAGVDPEHIDATYRQGVLTVKLPLKEEQKPKRISVKG